MYSLEEIEIAIEKIAFSFDKLLKERPDLKELKLSKMRIKICGELIIKELLESKNSEELVNKFYIHSKELNKIVNYLENDRRN